MTGINAQNLLSPEEIAALLNNGKNDLSASITAIINAEKDIGSVVADAVEQALFREYLIEAEISFCGYGAPDSGQSGLGTKFENGGYIFFSTGFAKNLVNRILGGRQAKIDIGKNISPAAIAVMRDVTTVICHHMTKATGAKAEEYYFSTLTEALSDTFAEEKLPLCFSLTGEKMWLLPPKTANCQSQSPAGENNSLNNIAGELPLNAIAVVGSRQITLRRLSQWQTGYFLPLGIEKNAEISILCGNKVILQGVLGQKMHRIAVKITKKVLLK